MPIIKSTKKRMKQNLKRRERNYPLRSELKTVIKKSLLMAKEGKTEDLQKFLSHAYSVIDTAVKKKLIHSNNAAHKKSRLARELASIGKSEKKAVVKEEKVEKKEEKVEERNEEVAE